ncbi:Guard cell S-type anion channel SLAC1 [Acorus gramineus]|uniref:Guard cell S-type anion channel SLAC1 n=1 Tax=Acorus gramineus TaxID=55184 RepID=A0AAV9ACQ2_ACOGR|nr:Guard cell S-type anion channel SLAC1 [Acorus gramineus]
MASKQTPNEDHFVDIHPVLPEEDEESERPTPMPFRPRFERRPQKSFSRQVSLETGFSALKKESRGGDDDRRMLSRSGRSLTGYRGGGGDVVRRKGDFDLFRTKSSLSKQNSLLPLRRDQGDHDRPSNTFEASGAADASVNQRVPGAGRYFAALRGPELDQVKDSEDILLPKDEKWPFLLRFPIGCFGICLGLSSQAILWGALSTSPATRFLHVTPNINIALWLLALAALLSVSLAYSLKCTFYFEAVRREFFHPVRVNFFFAPWIVCMFLSIGVPPSFSAHHPLHPALWCAFMFPVFFLELKIYGQWLSGGKRRLCKVANPSTHLSVVGNFVGAILATKVGWPEPAKFLWAVGLAHYLVVFVTLYQRLPTNEALPKDLHPVYSMFIAAPSAASIAWGAIYGEFDSVSRTCYFIALFLYASLVVRINFFRGFQFSVAWWSYTFPMTTASLATIKYAEAVPCEFSKGLSIVLSLVSSTMVSVLFISTLLHAFVWRSLFPNDLAIAITKNRNWQAKKKRPLRKAYDIRRWTKQSPLSIVSNFTKNVSDKKGSAEDERMIQ